MKVKVIVKKGRDDSLRFLVDWEQVGIVIKDPFNKGRYECAVNSARMGHDLSYPEAIEKASDAVEKLLYENWQMYGLSEAPDSFDYQAFEEIDPNSESIPIREILCDWIEEDVGYGRKFRVAEKEGVFAFDPYLVHVCYGKGRISEDEMLEMCKVK